MNFKQIGGISQMTEHLQIFNLSIEDCYKIFYEKGYQFEEIISTNSRFGVVVKLQQIATKRFVACKIAKESNDSYLSFGKNEAKSIQKAFFLSQGLSIEFLEEFTFMDHHAIITSYGGDNLLNAFVKKTEPLSISTITDFLTTALDYYDRVFTAKFEHNDIKPENIVYDGKTFRFIDFGDWRKIGSKSIPLRISQYWRTPSVAKENVDGSATSFSLGCVLAEILTRQPLFLEICKKEVSDNFLSIEHFLLVFNFIPLTENPHSSTEKASNSPIIDYVENMKTTLGDKEKHLIDNSVIPMLTEGFVENRFLTLVKNRIATNNLDIGSISEEAFQDQLVSFLKLMLSYDTPPDPKALQEHPFVYLCKSECQQKDQQYA